VDILDGFWREANLPARGYPIRLADVFILEPGKKGNKLVMRDGSNKRVSVKIEQQLFEASAIIGDGVGLLPVAVL